MARTDVLYFGLLVLIAVPLYFGALDNPYHYDDHHSISQNLHIRSLESVPRFFSDTSTFSAEARGTMFRPLLLLSYALNYSAGGGAPEAFRWTNLALHVLCAFAVYRLAASLGLGSGAWAAGLYFLLHPTHAEMVNYLSSRSDLLSAAFYLYALLLLLQGPRVGGYLLYTGALLSKSVAITLPAVLLARRALDGIGALTRQWAHWAVLGAISAVYLGTVFMNRFVPDSLAKAPRGLGAQVWTQAKGLVYYLWLAVMPVRLSVEHQFFVSSPWDPTALAAAALGGSLGYLAWRGRRALPAWGYAFFVVALLPASVMPLNILVSERRSYLAGAGLALLAGWAWQRLGAKRQAAWGVALVLGTLFAEKCLERNAVWASEESVWREAVEGGPHMFRARMNLALALQRDGREDEALTHLRRALELKEDYAAAWAEVGNILFGRGDFSAAEKAYRRALESDPTLAGAYYNLGNMCQARGDFGAASGYYAQALRWRPDMAEARNNWGQALEAVGKLNEAAAQYGLALAVEPEMAEAWFNLAALNERRRDRRGAVDAYRRALSLLRGRVGDEAELFAGRAAAALQRLQRDENHP